MGNDSINSWPKWRLKELAEIRTGGTPRRDVREYWGGEIPWMSSGEVNARYVRDVKERITEAGFNASNVVRLSPGTTMMALAGQGSTRGKVALLETETTCNQSLVGITPSEIMNERFLFFQLDSMYDEIRAINGDQVRAGLNLDLVGNISVIVPPLAEQKKIAQILSSVDEAIEATQAVIDQTRRVKEAMLQTLLTRGLGHTRFKQTEIGEIPEAWEVRRLDEVLLDGPRNGVYKPANEIGEGTMIVGQTAFTEDRLIDFSQTRRARASTSDLDRFGLGEGDVLVTRVYATPEGCGRPAFVRGLPEPAMFESNMMRLRANPERVLPEFLFYWLQVASVRAYLMARASSSNQTSINQTTLGAVPIPLVSLSEQRHAVTIINALHDAVRSTSEALTQLQRTKSALLQTLLSGQTRVTP